MRVSRLASLVAALAVTLPALAQDQDFFGAALTFSGSDLLVVKRAPARGPAAVIVYRLEGGTWRRVQELRAPGAVERGYALSPGIAAAGGTVIVGAGAPGSYLGAHAWRHAGTDWRPAGDLTVGAPPTGEITVSLATVFQILSPAPRAVAVHGDLVLIGFQQTAHLFRRTGNSWVAVPVLLGGGASVGTAVALGPHVAVLGRPLGQAGSVIVLAPSDSGVWGTVTTLVPDSLPVRSRFGTALALDDNTLAVGAPNAADGVGVTLVYTRRRDGRWIEQARLSLPGVTAFGSAVALRGDELVVGTSRDGVMRRYVRRRAAWHDAGEVVAPGARGLGALALALGPDGLAVGSPLADGGRGRVWVFPRDGAAFGPPVELAPAASPASVTSGQVRCGDGVAGAFRCHDVDLESFLSIADLGGAPGDRISDVWGWSDPATGREYALVGISPGLVFVDITTPASPRILGMMPANSSGARDIKVYRDHAFMTGDGAGQHGLMVFNLTRLRAQSGPPATFAPDTVYRGIASAHNLAIDTASGLAVPMAATAGGETCGGGLHLVDVRTPTAPVFAGCYTDSEGLIAPGRTHDAQCVIYHGPDTTHQGRNICFASNETALRVVDVTDRANPTPLSAASYPGAVYIHQGWLTEDHRYFYLDDELDELVGTTMRTRTMIWDISDLDDPVMVGTYLGPDGATDHNLYVKGNRMYQANYQAGLRVVDISDPEAPREIGFFDTTPYDGNPAGFYGAWTAFPYFASGAVIVSSMQEGLFVLRPRTQPLVP